MMRDYHFAGSGSLGRKKIILKIELKTTTDHVVLIFALDLKFKTAVLKEQIVP